MPQEIRVLKCFHCNIFQVDIVKKSNKWQCRVCNMKQTLRKEYYRGTGTECRAKVQELNMQEGKKHNENIQTFLEVMNMNGNSPLEIKEDKTNDVICENEDNDRKDELKEKLSPSSSNDVSIMFNYSQSKKWSSSSRSDQKRIAGFSNNGNILGNEPKKSKWDNYL